MRRLMHIALIRTENMHPQPPLKIRDISPSARLVPARVLAAEGQRKGIERIRLKKV